MRWTEIVTFPNTTIFAKLKLDWFGILWQRSSLFFCEQYYVLQFVAWMTESFWQYVSYNTGLTSLSSVMHLNILNKSFFHTKNIIFLPESGKKKKGLSVGFLLHGIWKDKVTLSKRCHKPSQLVLSLVDTVQQHLRLLNVSGLPSGGVQPNTLNH